MNKKNSFDYSLSDSQATKIDPLSVRDFDFGAYKMYEELLLGNCNEFWESESGVLVYRRMRVSEVFSYGCRDRKKSLEWQLGALNESMKFRADVPNFLEPWYGIGTAASAFGFDYVWKDKQSPAMNGKFVDSEEALQYEAIPIAKTPIGKHTLNMIEYFLEETRGELPISFCDIQSPLNVAESIIDINNFMMDFYLKPDKVKLILDRIVELMVDFTNEQVKLCNDALVYPGHGFASCRKFSGFGMSNDIMIMLPDDLYSEFVTPSNYKAARPFGGSVIHSCGNWENKIDVVKETKGLKMVDAAFSAETDPDHNNTGAFASEFNNTGIVVNARIVGGLKEIEEKVRGLWMPGMKLIVVTYCNTPEEQEEAYQMIHEICK